MLQILDIAPDFTAKAVVVNTSGDFDIKSINLKLDYLNNYCWVVLLFYPVSYTSLSPVSSMCIDL